MLSWRYGMLFVVFLAGNVLAEIPRNDNIAQMHQEALELAREGEIDQALAQLAQLSVRLPDRPQYLYDYIAVLGWAERDAEVLQHAERLTLARLPPYVLETIGKSARNLKQYELAIQAYQVATQRDPQRLQSRLGLALALSDHQKGTEALAVFADYDAAGLADEIVVLESEAYANIALKRYFSSLARYEKILQLKPDHQNALRGRILMTHRLGAPHLAASMAKEHPGLLSVNEMAAINSDVAAISIRWRRISGGSADAEILQKEQAKQTIDALKKRLTELKSDDPSSRIQYHRVAFDLMIALQIEQRMTEVIALYLQLVEQKALFPPHALLAAADAYLSLEQPEKARDLYLEVLGLGEKLLAVQLSLFYAYIESEEYDNAIELIDRLNEQQPRRKKVAGSPVSQPNPDKVSVEITAAYARAYIDQLPESQQRLESIHRLAPANIDIRASLAYIYLWRGWPRRALEEFEIAAAQDELHLDTAIGGIHANYALYEFPTVEQNLQTLNSRYPEHLRLSGVNRLWQLHNMRELRVEFSRGISSGSQEGIRDLTLNSYLYGRPLRDHYRPYIHHLHTQARFPEAKSHYRRIGAGIEYRGRDLEVRSELSRNLGGAADIGLNSEAVWMVDDYWSLSANIDSYSNEVPLRGREQGIDGWGTGVGTSYRFHERRRIDAFLQWLEFSDNNRRQRGGVSIDQRLLTKVDYKLTGIASLNMSKNTRENAPYFNPLSDLTVELGIINEWLLRRHYDYAYRHRLGIMLGQYQQKNFKTRPIWTVRYEHQWNFNDRTELRYAISRGQRAYDGDTELSTQFDLTFIWRF